MAKLCLNMIVRNEADRIIRCLKSVAPYIHCYNIVDTGSTDETIDLIKHFFDSPYIPGEITAVPFKDFSQARNAALTAARDMEVDYDYILLCDADMELVVENPDVFRYLDQKSYNVAQHSGSLSYMNKRLVHRITAGMYRGVTHEYLDVGHSDTLTGVHFKDHADGANRKDKYDRDIKLLLQGLRDEPYNSRYQFYLARTYDDAGHYDTAIKAYQLHIAMEGWVEEVWYSKYRLASCYKALGREADYVSGMLDAYAFRPGRAEPIYSLAHHYRDKSKNAPALMFALSAAATPLTQDLLFVEPIAYKHGPLEEISITGFYGNENDRKDGFAAANALVLDRTTPAWIYESTKKNLFHYLKPLSEICSSFSAKQIEFTPPAGYLAMNPSIARFQDAYWMLIRTVNYRMPTPNSYVIGDEAFPITEMHPVHTRTFLALFDPVTFTVSPPSEVYLPQDWPEPKYHLVRAWEDMRLIAHGDQLWVSAAVREHAEDGLPEQFDARINQVGYLDNWRRLEYGPRACQKNWCPVEASPRMYQYRVGTIIDGRGFTWVQNTPAARTDDFSGGSQLIKFDGGFLTVVHETAWNPTGGRYYQHRFIKMDHEFVPTHISLPFVLHATEIEYVMGLAVYADKVILSYGRRDAEAWVATVSRADVHNLLGVTNGA
jgi:glycosyltransferase involved in cell wall biosynthesis